MKNIFCFFFLFFLSSFTFADVQRAESISHFDSNIVVNKDASVDITETITVNAQQIEIKHGIVRSLPMHYTDSYGRTLNSKYNLTQILLNGLATPYSVQIENNNFMIYVGDKNTFLTPGIYIYSIKYHVNNAINFLKDGDELYWNITGNEWSFPIEKATATIHLPEGAKILNSSAYTGFLGEKGKAFTSSEIAPNQISFVTTSPLPPGAGLTIAVAWPKGIVHAPTILEQIKQQLNESSPEASILAGVILLYFLLAWFLVGRGPAKGTIIPLFEPPENLAATDINYLYNMGTTNKILSVAIVSMATKGYLNIINNQRTFSLQKLGKNADLLTPEEKNTADAFFGNETLIEIVKLNSTRISKAIFALYTSLYKKYKGKYFHKHVAYFIPGLVLGVIAFILVGATPEYNDASADMIIMAVFAYFGCNRLTYIVKKITESNSIFSFSQVGGLLFNVLGAVGLFGISFYVMINSIIPIPTMFALFLIVIMIAFFRRLLVSFTVSGRKLTDQIEGFKLFLGTTERYRLEQFNPPEKTPELFEKYLAYAMALDVENKWGEQFTEVFEKAAETQAPYQPRWYNGPGFTPATAASFPAFLSTALTSSISSASASDSSSASGGGGSSGGGRGGGGGGGW